MEARFPAGEEFGPASSDHLKGLIAYIDTFLERENERRYFDARSSSVLILQRQDDRYILDQSTPEGEAVYRMRMLLGWKNGRVSGDLATYLLRAIQPEEYERLRGQVGRAPHYSDCRRIIGALDGALELPTFADAQQFTARVRMLLLKKSARIQRDPVTQLVTHRRQGQAVLPDKRVCSLFLKDSKGLDASDSLGYHCAADFVTMHQSEEVWGLTRLREVKRYDLKYSAAMPLDLQTITVEEIPHLEIFERGGWQTRDLSERKRNLRPCSREDFYTMLAELPVQILE